MTLQWNLFNTETLCLIEVSETINRNRHKDITIKFTCVELKSVLKF